MVDAHTSEEAVAVRAAEQKRGTKRMNDMNTRVNEYGTQAAHAFNGVNEMLATFKMMLDRGVVVNQQELAAAIQTSPEAWAAIAHMKNDGATMTRLREYTVAAADSLPEKEGQALMEEFAQRWVNAGAGMEQHGDVFRDLLERYSSIHTEKVAGPLRKERNRLTAIVEGKKVEDGDGQRPAQGGGASVVGAPLSREIIQKMSNDEYRSRRKEIMDYQRQQLAGT
jgi:hypothetical protein